MYNVLINYFTVLKFAKKKVTFLVFPFKNDVNVFQEAT